MSNKILAWHFLNNNKKLGHGDGRAVVKGRILKCKGPIMLCECGLHASIKVLDALYCSTSSQRSLCRVELSGDILFGDNKVVASERKVITRLNTKQTENILREFACRVAEDVLPVFEKQYPYDKRPSNVISATRMFEQGLITNGELEDARAESRDAYADANEAARNIYIASATCDAYASAYAAHTASSAAHAFTGTAAELAVDSAASVAGYAAYASFLAAPATARVAANEAADSAIDKYNGWLEEMFNNAFRLK